MENPRKPYSAVGMRGGKPARRFESASSRPSSSHSIPRTRDRRRLVLLGAEPQQEHEESDGADGDVGEEEAEVPGAPVPPSPVGPSKQQEMYRHDVAGAHELGRPDENDEEAARHNPPGSD